MWDAVQPCKKSELSGAARKRVLADWKRLQTEPLPLATAQPCSDEDLSLWDGVIGVEMEVTHFGSVTVPLHFLIDFPQDYPQSAPNIGFSFEFQYRGGAQYVMPDGRLKGKKVICLDVLGNFQSYHTEWKDSVGSGWSPAYTVTTLLVQLQSVLCDLGQSMSQRERDVTYQSAVRFCEKNPKAILELLDEEDIRERKDVRLKEDRLAKVCGSNDALAARVQAFAREAGIVDDPSRMDEFLQLLADVAGAGGSSGSGSGDLGPVIDANICCFSTGKLYTEALLGVGVARERKNLATAAELLSKEAFDGGLRQSTNKSPFEFFLPVWINETHAAGNAVWCDALQKSVLKIGTAAYEVRSEDDAILEVFPRLINQMIVEMMKPDAGKSEAIALFEALCNFWRTLRYLVDTRVSLREKMSTMLSKFVSDKAWQHKDKTPDLGMILVFFTVLQGHKGCPSRAAFIKAYAGENSLRWVMWWQRSNTPARAGPVFEATKVSREICMFQLMVVDIVIGDVVGTLKAMEETNCKLPDRLELLQAEWRKRKESTKTWSDYFKNIGTAQPMFSSIDLWIADCVSQVASMGPKYGGAKGNGGKGNSGRGTGGWQGGRGGGKGGAWGKGW